MQRARNGGAAAPVVVVGSLPEQNCILSRYWGSLTCYKEEQTGRLENPVPTIRNCGGVFVLMRPAGAITATVVAARNPTNTTRPPIQTWQAAP
jgi:hypothetical protein